MNGWNRSLLGVGKLPLNLSETRLTFTGKPENQVFNPECPLTDPYGSGYRGQCQQFDPEMSEEIKERLWTTMSRLESRTCQWKLVEHFCAFLFNPHGLCVPPGVLEGGGQAENDISKLRFNERVYPKTGWRQNLNETELTSRDTLLHPPRLGFTLHDDCSKKLDNFIFSKYIFF